MVASRAAFRAETDAASYAVSKAGMVSLARCLARNEGRHGITANSICPGWVDTEMARPDVAARKAEIEARSRSAGSRRPRTAPGPSSSTSRPSPPTRTGRPSASTAARSSTDPGPVRAGGRPGDGNRVRISPEEENRS